MGQISKTIQMLVTAGISTSAMMLATGCMDAAAPTQANGVHGDVTDVRPMATAAYQPPAYDTTGLVPVAPQPVTPPPMIATAPDTAAYSPMISSTPVEKTVGGKSHKVQKGETLYSIAKATYGDGKMWKKIVAANPGVSASKLKVGQVLTMPA
jgi:5'-nucleotidase